jgi:hypothetical protein
MNSQQSHGSLTNVAERKLLQQLKLAILKTCVASRAVDNCDRTAALP